MWEVFRECGLGYAVNNVSTKVSVVWFIYIFLPGTLFDFIKLRIKETKWNAPTTHNVVAKISSDCDNEVDNDDDDDDDNMTILMIFVKNVSNENCRILNQFIEYCWQIISVYDTKTGISCLYKQIQ